MAEISGNIDMNAELGSSTELVARFGWLLNVCEYFNIKLMAIEENLKFLFVCRLRSPNTKGIQSEKLFYVYKFPIVT